MTSWKLNFWNFGICQDILEEQRPRGPLVKNKHFGATVSEILPQLCSDNSTWILLNLTWVELLSTLYRTALAPVQNHITTGGFCKREKLRCADRESGLPHIGRFSATFCGSVIWYWNRSDDSERRMEPKKSVSKYLGLRIRIWCTIAT